MWAWGTSQTVRNEQIAEMRETMLRETYRLEPESHQNIHGACQRAMLALGIDAPVTLYQAGGNEMNASLCFIPGEILIVLLGPMVERLDEDELVALFGHELAHYQLWSSFNGEFYAANSILDHALAYADASASLIETNRLFRLHTEIYADRGAAVAVGGIEPAIKLLLKTTKSIAKPDAQAYLRQAAEIESRATGSKGESHPEVFLRVQALDKWWRIEAGGENWIKNRILGPMSLSSLDLMRQIDLTNLTQSYLLELLQDSSLRTDAVLTEIKTLFPHWPDCAKRLNPDELNQTNSDQSIGEYFTAISFDMAMADLDVRDDILSAGARAAERISSVENYKTALKRDLKLSKSVIDRIIANANRAQR